jgi:hypothetical protein
MWLKREPNPCLQATPDFAEPLVLSLWSGVPEAKRSAKSHAIDRSLHPG